MPTQNHSPCGKKKTEWLKMKVSRITLWWAGLKVQNGCKNLEDSPCKCEGWCWKENVNEEHWQMKNNNNKMKINITKTSWTFSQASTIAWSFWLLILKMITELIITKLIITFSTAIKVIYSNGGSQFKSF